MIVTSRWGEEHDVSVDLMAGAGLPSATNTGAGGRPQTKGHLDRGEPGQDSLSAAEPGTRLRNAPIASNAGKSAVEVGDCAAFRSEVRRRPCRPRRP